MKIRLPFVAQAHQPDAEALSAHLDGRLDTAAAAALDEHLRGCAACATDYNELQRTRALVQSLPEVAHPRSFRLRQTDVERLTTGARPRAAAPAFLSWMPAASAAAILVFAVVLGYDRLLQDDDGGDRFRAASIPVAEMQATERSTQADAPAGTLAGDDAAQPADAPADEPGASAEQSLPGPNGTAAASDGDSFDDGAASRAADITPQAAEAPATGATSEEPSLGEATPQAAEAPPPDATAGETTAGEADAGDAAGPPPPLTAPDTAAPPDEAEDGSEIPPEEAPVPTAAPTPAAAGNLSAEAESCDAECMRDREMAELQTSIEDDGDGDAWLLTIEIIAGLVALGAGAGAIVWWKRSKET